MRSSLALLFLFMAHFVGMPAQAVLMPVDVPYAVDGLAQRTPVAAGSGTADVNGAGGGAQLTSLVVLGGLAMAMATSTPTSFTLPVTKISVTVGAGTFTETMGGVLRGAMGAPGQCAPVRILELRSFW